MKTRYLILLPSLVLGNFSPSQAQTAPTPPANGPLVNPPAVTAPAEKTNPALNKPVRPRAVSGDVAASISAAMPKFNPPPKKPEPKPGEEAPDLREIDKPRNGIIRLPEHVVQEKRPAVLNERDVYTKAGLGALAVRRYITDADLALNRFTIPLFSPISLLGSGSATTDRALLMYAEDERLKNMAALKDDAGLVGAGDKAAGTYIRREAQQTYQRRDDFGWNGGTAGSEARK